MVIAVAIILMAGCTYFLKAADGTTYRSPDGSMVAVVQQGVVSVNGQVQNPGFDGIYSEGVKFCPDGKRVGYVAIKKGKFHVIIDGRDSGPFDNLMSQTGLHFSPKCKHVAIPIVSGSKWHMWIDGELSVGYDAIVIGQVVFSDDENQFAYRAKRGEQWVVVSNRREVYASGFDLPAAPIGFLSTGQLYFFSFTSERKMQLHIGDSIGEQFQVLSGNGVKLLRIA